MEFSSVKELTELISHSIDIMTYGNSYKAQTKEEGLFSVDFIDTEVVLCYNGLQVFHIDRSIHLRTRLSIHTARPITNFYTQNMDNGMAEIVDKSDMYNNDITVIPLVPKVSEEDWDSVFFQLSTLYSDKVCIMLMLEAYITECISKHAGFRSYRVKLYSRNEWWKNEIPFGEINQWMKKIVGTVG